MSESFVDLSYRGLNLGKRIKLTQVRPSTAYLEMPAPMPIGTTIGIATDEGVLFEAQVAEVREQVTGSDRIPGMVVKPKLDAEAVRSWWKQRVSLPEAARAEPPPRQAPQADAGGKVTIARRDSVPPPIVDDGRTTSVMNAMIDSAPPIPSPSEPRRTNPGMGAMKRDADPAQDAGDSGSMLVDDGKRTTAMSAVDLAALGLEPSMSGQMPVVTSLDDDDGDDGDKPGPEPETKAKKKRRRR